MPLIGTLPDSTPVYTMDPGGPGAYALALDIAAGATILVLFPSALCAIAITGDSGGATTVDGYATASTEAEIMAGNGRYGQRFSALSAMAEIIDGQALTGLLFVNTGGADFPAALRAVLYRAN